MPRCRYQGKEDPFVRIQKRQLGYASRTGGNFSAWKKKKVEVGRDHFSFFKEVGGCLLMGLAK